MKYFEEKRMWFSDVCSTIKLVELLLKYIRGPPFILILRYTFVFGVSITYIIRKAATAIDSYIIFDPPPRRSRAAANPPLL